MVAWTGMLLAIMVIATACGGGASGNPGTGASTTPSTTAARTDGCRAPGTTLRVSARDNRFDQQCLAALAGTPVVITLANVDRGVPHNLAIYSDPQRTRALFKGRVVAGVTTVVYRVGPLPAQTYYFQCDVHPQTMQGTFVVG